MKKLKAFTFITATMAFTASALAMFDLAAKYMTVGYGLHPFISIPGGIALLAIPFAFMFAMEK